MSDSWIQTACWLAAIFLLALACAMSISPLHRVLSDPGGTVLASSALGGPIGSDDGAAAEADVVLQRDRRSRYLPPLGQAAQLPVQLGALRQTGGSERVAFGDQAAGGVDHPAPAVGGFAAVDELVPFALSAQPDGFVGEQLVGCEAVVQLDDVHIVRADAGLLVDLLRRPTAHLGAHERD